MPRPVGPRLEALGRAVGEQTEEAARAYAEQQFAQATGRAVSRRAWVRASAPRVLPTGDTFTMGQPTGSVTKNDATGDVRGEIRLTGTGRTDAGDRVDVTATVALHGNAVSGQAGMTVGFAVRTRSADGSVRTKTSSFGSDDFLSSDSDRCPRTDGTIRQKTSVNGENADLFEAVIGGVKIGQVTSTTRVVMKDTAVGRMGPDSRLQAVDVDVNYRYTISGSLSVLFIKPGPYEVGYSVRATGKLDPATGTPLPGMTVKVTGIADNTGADARIRREMAEAGQRTLRERYGDLLRNIRTAEAKARNGGCVRVLPGGSVGDGPSLSSFDPVALAAGQQARLRPELGDYDHFPPKAVDSDVTWEINRIKGDVTPLASTTRTPEFLVTGAPRDGSWEAADLEITATSRMGIARARWTPRQQAHLTITTTANPASFTDAGQAVALTYTVKNTGGIPIDGLAVTDTALTGETAPVCDVSRLDPNGSTVCRATHTVTTTQAQAGSFTSSATPRAFQASPDWDIRGERTTATADTATVAIGGTDTLDIPAVFAGTVTGASLDWPSDPDAIDYTAQVTFTRVSTTDNPDGSKTLVYDLTGFAMPTYTMHYEGQFNTTCTASRTNLTGFTILPNTYPLPSPLPDQHVVGGLVIEAPAAGAWTYQFELSGWAGTVPCVQPDANINYNDLGDFFAKANGTMTNAGPVTGSGAMVNDFDSTRLKTFNGDGTWNLVPGGGT